MGMTTYVLLEKFDTVDKRWKLCETRDGFDAVTELRIKPQQNCLYEPDLTGDNWEKISNIDPKALKYDLTWINDKVRYVTLDQFFANLPKKSPNLLCDFVPSEFVPMFKACEDKDPPFIPRIRRQEDPDYAKRGNRKAVYFRGSFHDGLSDLVEYIESKIDKNTPLEHYRILIALE